MMFIEELERVGILGKWLGGTVLLGLALSFKALK